MGTLGPRGHPGALGLGALGPRPPVGPWAPAGLVASWNEANPLRAIGPGDEFVRVNGKTTNEEIIEELKGNVLDLVRLLAVWFSGWMPSRMSI